MRARRARPLWQRLALWAGGVAFVSWGVWQTMNFRRVLLAEVGKNEARAAKEGLTPSGDPITTRAAIAVGGESLVLAPTRGEEATIDLIDPLLSHGALALRDADGAATPLQAGPAVDEKLSLPELVTQGTQLLNAGETVKGRTMLNLALARTTDEAEAARLRRTLADLNGAVFLGTAVLEEDHAARFVDIRPGDTFLKLGKRYGVPGPYIEAVNPGLNPRNLKPLTGIKIVQGPFELRLKKRAARLDLYARDLYVRSFETSLPEGNYLPKGSYKISAGNKIQWAGRRWVGFAGMETATQGVDAGWIYGSAGPRGSTPRDRAAGIRLNDADLAVIYTVVAESRSHLYVEP